ncbi:Phospho-N-acetylmuramoyl-pentapeptide-transferase [Quadrisphaera granulorum]|uniref:Phospho-N-acetylmuramoyl-pentapeptide-transferase n=1 Tax=Quadrisphaera granulorum TaxID=317664 RepID=A0A316A8B3_9ACTN|nr:phospho-N-acetylmuramoyl-pentapeptide-transferase [Quadrisphaera granulorum]PWJ53679.1 phospho-N-acetylmuramoyl-pentapeptide-transferase [Quadrisphaera granulorum]SZE96723.1 Phospho-N-acetylmuramoyl-pentapeptide-transferase [Quadrisphaera granulorum]
MKGILVAGFSSLVVALFGTPLFIRFLVHRGYGQFIRDDGPTSHHTKRGTPTMGGAVIIAATVLGYGVAHLVFMTPPSVSGLLVLGLMVGLGLVGFLDDFIKISKQRSLGLRSVPKLIGQTLVGLVFAVLALQFPDGYGNTPASTKVSFTRDTMVDFAHWGAIAGVVLFVLWALLMIAATSNGVNLTDGLDGLASGATAAVAGAFALIGVWQYNQNCDSPRVTAPGVAACYTTRDPLDLAVVAIALMAACIGFLWWNASPAKVFMGDTGSLALGGALAGLAITTRTELLLVVLGGLFVIIALSVVIQVGFFKMTRKRVFRMAPLQHHFELVGWAEVTIVTRFWIIAGLFVGLGLGLFYGEWVVGNDI